MTTYAFTIDVAPQYLAEQSEPDNDRYVFSYTVTITNTGKVPAQLISRQWDIVDANGKHVQVKGLGVVGHQPLLKPGERFQYCSGTPLETASGTMKGSYFFVAEDGARFDVPIGEFLLSTPRTLH